MELLILSVSIGLVVLVGGIWFRSRRKALISEASPPVVLDPENDPLELPVKIASPARKGAPRQVKTWDEILTGARSDPEKGERYRVVDIRVHDDPANHQFLLNEMHSLGWVLHSSVAITSHTPEVRYIFQRKGLWG